MTDVLAHSVGNVVKQNLWKPKQMEMPFDIQINYSNSQCHFLASQLYLIHGSHETTNLKADLNIFNSRRICEEMFIESNFTIRLNFTWQFFKNASITWK